MEVRRKIRNTEREYSAADIDKLEGHGWIKFHPLHLTITQDARAAWLLAYGLNRARRSISTIKWWRATYKEINAATGLTRPQIDDARKILRGLGFWTERSDGKNNDYRIDYKSYAQKLRAERPDPLEDDTEDDLHINPRKAVKPQKIHLGDDGTALLRVGGVELYVDLSHDTIMEALAR